MWRVIVVAALSHILTVESRPADPLEAAEGPLWARNSHIVMQTFPFKDLQEVFRHHQPRDFQENENNPDSDYDLLVPHVQYDKRALAMMARWSPFSAMGKQRAPIRSAGYIDPESTINTQTRGRMVGQPLRWG